jgi:hypothetical protein
VGCALFDSFASTATIANIPVGSCPICFIVLSLEVPTTTCEISGVLQAFCYTYIHLGPILTILARNSSRTLHLESPQTHAAT